MAAYDYTSGGFPASPAADDTLAMKGTTYKYNGSAWEVQTGGTTSYTYTATSGQTAFTGADTGSKTLAYTAASLHVFLNGVLLDAADYTATDGTTVTLGTGASTGDTLQVVAYGVLVSAGGGGGGAWEVISSTTVTSTVTSVEMSLSGYDDYVISYNDIEGNQTSYDFIRFYFSTDGGSTFSSNITYTQLKNLSWTTTTYASNASSASYLGIGDLNVNQGSSAGLLRLSNKASVNPKHGTYNSTVTDQYGLYHIRGGYTVAESSVIDTVKFMLTGNNNGSITGGTFTLYGIKNS